eukprot:GHVP01048009.1.p1 GENE.GHVP01048009.1~~GHVP01048009.1.p1  ORF type:complete len:113 (+),score=8.33 GHVP01048009.1:169-507(+)
MNASGLSPPSEFLNSSEFRASFLSCVRLLEENRYVHPVCHSRPYFDTTFEKSATDYRFSVISFIALTVAKAYNLLFTTWLTIMLERASLPVPDGGDLNLIVISSDMHLLESK